jgi:RNA polymerase sigma factor (sigma-70 family)
MGVQEESAGSVAQDNEVFTPFYRNEYRAALRLTLALGVSTPTAEDVVQEAFVRVHRHLSEIDNPGGYLRTTIVNLCSDWHRRQGRERRHRFDVTDHPPVSLGASELLDIIGRLPYRWRAVLVLRYWADWTEAEIATALGCRPGTVKTLAARSLRRLRRELST